MKIVSVSNISKNYGKTTALKDISFDVEKGEIFGLIGPDGAGKTTIFRILTTLILADSGTAVVDGSDVVQQYKEIRKKVGYMPGRFSLYKDLTVEENLNVFATLFGTTIEENYHLIEAIYSQIEPFKNRKSGDLSGGMKQKLALSCALIHEPVILFLDEPTTGVDPVSRKELWEVLKGLKKEGVTIVISTPYMDEASLCDRVALMQNGAFMQIDSPENVMASFKKQLWSVRSKDMYRLLKDLRQNSQIESSYSFGDAHHVIPNFDSEKSVAIYHEENLKEFLVKRGHIDIEILPIRAGIEDCFMQLTET